MVRCSGLTCGWKNPDNRFDLFVECLDARVGLFAAQFAVHAVRKIMTKKLISPRYKQVLELATRLQRYPKLPADPMVLAERLGWRPGVAEMAIERLHRFGFFFDSDSERQSGEVRSA